MNVSNRPKRLRRSQLAVPGSSEKMLTKAAGLGVDHVFCDLEDAVAPSAKEGARATIVAALNELDWGQTVRCVRVNDATTQWCYGDIISIVEGARENLDTIMLTKPLDASDILFADKLLTQLEKSLGLKKRIGLECLIEEVEALHNVWEIAHASDRLECMIFGMGDYSASQGMSVKDIGEATYPGDIWHYPRYQLTIAARAAGIDAVDGPYADFSNAEGYAEECRRSVILGMVGKWAIHPSQIEPATRIFSPDQEDVLQARELISAYREAEAQGIGSVNVQGKMVDAATARIFQNTVDRADLIGM
ncbi:MAG: CoA ester lyase [Pseudomonadota bacterium]